MPQANENRRRLLFNNTFLEKYKTDVIDFNDANLSAAVVEVTEHLLNRFKDLQVSRSMFKIS